MCRGGLRTLMVTGNYHHTAIAVARGVGMVPPGGPLIIIQSRAELQSATKPPGPSYGPSHGRAQSQPGASNPQEPGSSQSLWTHKSALRDPGGSVGPGGSKGSAPEGPHIPSVHPVPERGTVTFAPKVPLQDASQDSAFLPRLSPWRSNRVAPMLSPGHNSCACAAVHDHVAASPSVPPAPEGAVGPSTPLEPAAFPLSLGHMEACDQEGGCASEGVQAAVALPETSGAVAVKSMMQSDSGRDQNRSCDGLVFVLQSKGHISWGLDPQQALTKLAQVPCVSP